MFLNILLDEQHYNPWENTSKMQIILKEKQNIDKKVLLALTSNSSSNVKISRQILERHNFQHEVKKIKQWHIKNALHLFNLYSPNILQLIQDIKFPHLKILSLRNNWIESIQPLCQIYMPNLLQLHLSENNFIANIKSLRKCNFKNLNLIYLPKYVQDIGYLCEGNFPSLTYFDFDHISIFNSCNWTFKLQTKIMIQLKIPGKIPPVQMKKLKSKFTQVKTRSNFLFIPNGIVIQTEFQHQINI